MASEFSNKGQGSRKFCSGNVAFFPFVDGRGIGAISSFMLSSLQKVLSPQTDTPPVHFKFSDPNISRKIEQFYSRTLAILES